MCAQYGSGHKQWSENNLALLDEGACFTDVNTLQERIRYAVLHIRSWCESSIDARALINGLLIYDWESVAYSGEPMPDADIVAQKTEWEQRYSDFKLTEPLKCDCCGSTYPISELSEAIVKDGFYNKFNSMKPILDRHILICQRCLEKNDNRELSVVCAGCQQLFIDLDHLGVCPRCCFEYRYEKTRVDQNNRRTERLGLIATLTLAEWLRLLNQWAFKCAYCKTAAFEEMDHIIPVNKGGGTEKDNVLPSCKKCNREKWDYGHCAWLAKANGELQQLKLAENKNDA